MHHLNHKHRKTECSIPCHTFQHPHCILSSEICFWYLHGGSVYRKQKGVSELEGWPSHGLGFSSNNQDRPSIYGICQLTQFSSPSILGYQAEFCGKKTEKMERTCKID